jgi:hypothetical protein
MLRGACFGMGMGTFVGGGAIDPPRSCGGDELATLPPRHPERSEGSVGAQISQADGDLLSTGRLFIHRFSPGLILSEAKDD